ncbi:glycosyltransferase family 2 protein [Yoonia vestfoldensis]|uniref:glycosyltransferase family 2 protein n=1 Tax=Yoonia vestfoldensis TaxID=245188 RepID=UPI0003755E2E|nr:glycosyltransferase family 2 protein [Yoonia vestfoldensis]
MALMIESVLDQSYANLELCIADDCSSDPEIRRVLTRYAGRDDRIKLVFREENGHISQASNSALEVASGEFVALLDHDDILDQDALLLMAQAICANPGVKILYSDEDKINADGIHFDPHFKPDWNRDLLYSCNYVSHLGVYQSALMRQVGGFRQGFEGAQDHDLLLRCVENVADDEIIHIPKVLYSWRATPGSTAGSGAAKPYATAAGQRAVAEHLWRTTGQIVEVDPGPYPFTYRPKWTVTGDPLVSIIIPTRDHLDVLKVAVDSILSKTEYRNFELIIVDNGSVDPRTLQWFDQIMAQDDRVDVRRDDGPFNYSALNNAAVAQSRGEFIALVNNDVEVISPGWLSEMLALAQRPGTGCVGAKLYYPDGRIQHGGVIIGFGDVAGHGHLFFPGGHAGYFGRLALRQNLTAVTGACLVVSRSAYDEVGGLNEADLAVAFNDIDFCLKVREAGYSNVWTPWAELTHQESTSRGVEGTPEKKARFKRECDYMKQRWKTDVMKDPAYNPNLTVDRSDFSFAPRNGKSHDFPASGQENLAAGVSIAGKTCPLFIAGCVLGYRDLCAIFWSRLPIRNLQKALATPFAQACLHLSFIRSPKVGQRVAPCLSQLCPERSDLFGGLWRDLSGGVFLPQILQCIVVLGDNARDQEKLLCGKAIVVGGRCLDGRKERQRVFRRQMAVDRRNVLFGVLPHQTRGLW